MASVKHYFNVEVAKEAGINAAIIFENLSFWINHNAKTGRNEREGVHWMYASQKDIAAQFEYLTIKQTRTALEKLEVKGYIKTGVFNRHGYDRTRWYALTEKGAALLPDGQTEKPLKAKGSSKEGAPIPDIKKDNKITDLEERKRELAARCGIAL